MRPSKEECLELVQVVANWGTHKQYLTLKQLVEEHFDLYEKYITLECSYGDMKEYYELQITRLKKSLDNPPLKFEELKEGMWVWDNKDKVYNKINKPFYFASEKAISFMYYNSITSWGELIQFEENRYYLREVKE